MRRLGLILSLSLVAAPVAAQVTVPANPARLDTVVRRPKPFNYFMRSAVLPGWGQASLDRKLTAGIFVAFEGLALGMALKAGNELSYLRLAGADTALVTSKRNERQDWIVLIAVNHLIAACEAFVSANLFDFPADLRMQRFPGGRTGIGMTIGVPR